MTDEIEINYSDIVDDKEWKSFEEFISINPKSVEKDIKESIEWRRKYREELLKNKELRKNIFFVKEEELQWARSQLSSGNVTAVDGTLSTYHLSTGTRCRIGIVATTYKNRKIEKVIFISEGRFIKNAKEPRIYFEKISKVRFDTPLILRTIMFYKERDVALKSRSEWKFVHGPLVPSELLFEKGTLSGAFEKNLELAQNIFKDKKIAGIVSDTSKLEYFQAGDILNRGEYMFINYKSNDLIDLLERHLSKEHKEMIEDFIDDYASHIKVGIFRAGAKPYIFEAHEDNFDKIAALIIEDSRLQQLRGFPLLIDYADSVCKSLLAQEDFTREIEYKLIKVGGLKTFGFDVPERLLRRR
jgi:hypothetical protein